jgi:1,4-dihydroxy-2-naphthoate octaprenyltransferase
VLGGLAAIFYVAPPIRWAYRGLGETVIALSYGPWMVLGSLYLHARALSWGAFWASLVPGFLIMSLAVVNAIPDYHQDRLVGKRNLVVRLGRRRGVWLYLLLAGAGLMAVIAGVIAGQFPAGCLMALLALPLLVASARAAVHTYESPRQFVPAIRSIVGCYALAVVLFGTGITLARP